MNERNSKDTPPAPDLPADDPSVSPDSRRRALKGIAVGGGLLGVSRWTTPLVDAAVLPAHAQASGFGCNIEFLQFSNFLLRVTVTPTPPFPPGATVQAIIQAVGDQGGFLQSSAFTEQTDAQGQATFNGQNIFDSLDAQLTSGIFQSGEDVSLIVVKRCLNPEECDAECELDITPFL